MKKGLNIWALPRALPLRERMRRTAEAGFDGIELSLTQRGETAFDLPDAAWDAVRRDAAGFGLEITDVACSLNWQCSLTSDDADRRERAKANLRRQIDVARRLGSTAVLALPGFVGLDFTTRELFGDQNDIAWFPGDEIVDYEYAYDRALAAFRELAPYAADNGVTIALENIWSKFLQSPLEMRGLIDAVGSPFVGCYFDVGNALLTGYPEHWIRILGKRIARVHFKDFRRGTARLSGFVELLTGDVDFPAVTQALRAAGYDGFVTAEINAYPTHPELTCGNCARALRAILDDPAQAREG